MSIRRKLLPGQVRKPTAARLKERRQAGIADAQGGLAFRAQYETWDAWSQEAYEFGRLCALGAWGPYTGEQVTA